MKSATVICTRTRTTTNDCHINVGLSLKLRELEIRFLLNKQDYVTLNVDLNPSWHCCWSSWQKCKMCMLLVHIILILWENWTHKMYCSPIFIFHIFEWHCRNTELSGIWLICNTFYIKSSFSSFSPKMYIHWKISFLDTVPQAWEVLVLCQTISLTSTNCNCLC